MVIDTSVLVAALAGDRSQARQLLQVLTAGIPVRVPATVFYEWSRGPRTSQEEQAFERLFPDAVIRAFGPQEARIAASLYRTLPGARKRQNDLAIAAHALAEETELWTLNREDFEDIPGLKLFRIESL